MHHAARRMRWRNPLIGLLMTLALTSSTPAHAASWLGFPTGWIVNCASGVRATDCIEKLELAKPGSNEWMSATPEVNDKFVAGTIEGSDNVTGNCGGGRGDAYDVCYVFPGQGVNGKDLRIRLQSGVGADVPGQQSLGLHGWVEAGGTVIATRQDGWKAEALPTGTRVRVTVKSDAFAREVGWLFTSFKNPLLEIMTGADGIKRTVMSGATDVMWAMKVGEDDPRFCERSDTTAGSVATGFLIQAQPYAFTTEKLKGSAPGGVMVGVNGRCGSGEAYFDANEGVLAVRVGGPHFDFEGKEIVGWLEASIRGDVVRKAFNKDPSKLDNVKVSVTYGGAEEQVATANTRYEKTTDSVEIRAYGFHFSAPQIRIRLSAPAPVVSKPPVKKLLTCVKGKVVKKVATAKCPAGYKRK